MRSGQPWSETVMGDYRTELGLNVDSVGRETGVSETGVSETGLNVALEASVTAFCTSS